MSVNNYKHFTKDERNEIYILLWKNYSIREIWKAIWKHHSSVAREIKRNSDKNGNYNPNKANHTAYVRRKYSKIQLMKIIENPILRDYITKKLIIFWSPEQIANRWNFIDGLSSDITISAPSIYKFLYSSYGQKFCHFLHSKRIKPKKRISKKSKKEIIKNRIFINDRPNIINNRSRFGDWEGDTLGTPKFDKNTVAWIIERSSRFVLFTKIYSLKYTIYAFNSSLNKFPLAKKSITLDNWVENTNFKKLNLDTYFCHPYSSWQKWAIENSFKRLRRFIPKKHKISLYSFNDIILFQNIMNNTPRKCLHWKTPSEVFYSSLINEPLP